MKLIHQEDLKLLTGYERPAEIAACLSKQGIPFFTGKRGRIWTTSNALDAVLGLTQYITQDNDRKSEDIEI